ncbi:MAG: DNA-binding protein Alba [Candidatus Nezhaarchaeota archaeon]|nr:DNA-binding protein Alba [Candidatus Nezhaarchaeota archaeon]
MNDNIIIIGQKPPMSYVLACLTLFHQGFDDVVIKARGKAISKAVDVVNIVKKKFIPSVRVKSLEIGSERLVNDKGKVVNLSTITITIANK